MNTLKYDLDKIKFGVDGATFKKAVDLYEKGKVTQFKHEHGIASAIVLGTHPYHVEIDDRGYNRGDCDCYLGQNDTLCKHMVAVAIYAIKEGEPLIADNRQQVTTATSSSFAGELNDDRLAKTKQDITEAMRYIKAYTGPSRTWFAYQASLSEGCARLATIVSGLPVSEQTAKLLVDLLLRLERKLMTGGVDDSDGSVGGCMQEIVEVLQRFAKLDPHCIKTFRTLKGRSTSFGWEEPLVTLFDQKDARLVISIKGTGGADKERFKGDCV